jgi:hypothetical protein
MALETVRVRWTAASAASGVSANGTKVDLITDRSGCEYCDVCDESSYEGSYD